MNILNLFKDKKIEEQTEVKNIEGISFENKSNILSTILYSRIMHEAADRASLPESIKKNALTLTLYDSYSPYKKGLISLIVETMIKRERNFYKKIKINDNYYLFEKVKKEEAYKDNKTLKPNILEINFNKFYESEIIELLIKLYLNTIEAMSNGVMLSKALLIKIHTLSDMIENSQNTKPLRDQLNQLNKAITKGEAGYIDAKSSVDLFKFDTKTTESAGEYIFKTISMITGIPSTYLYGAIAGGLGDMSDSEEKRLNVGIKRYFYSILSGVLYSTFDQVFEYKNLIIDIDNMINLFTWLETTLLLSDKQKQKIILDNTSLIAEIDNKETSTSDVNNNNNNNNNGFNY